jgi:threonyl-tRNA synthetase
MLLAKKFGMEYVDVDGEKKTPYIIHRTSLGCYERTLALLLEKFAGAMPLWLSPEQIRVIPISERLRDPANEVTDKLAAAGFRVSCDDRNEKMGYRIREAQLEKIPYMLIIGDKEVESGTVSVRARNGEDVGSMSLDAFISMATEEVATKKI